MRDERPLVIIWFASFMVRDMWQLYPINVEELCIDSLCPYHIRPFPLSNQSIAKATYFWLIGKYAAQFLWSFVPCALVQKTKLFFNAALMVAACELVECIINYNEPWGYFLDLPVNITSLRYLFFTVFSVPTFYLWKD